MTLGVLHDWSTWLALAAYLALVPLLLAAWARKNSGRTSLLATILTSLHLASRGLTGLSSTTLALETLALLAWILVLARLLGFSATRLRDPAVRYTTMVFGVALGLAAFSISYSIWAHSLAPAETLDLSLRYPADLLLAVTGLAFVEQLIRNVRAEERWRLRYLAVGLGAVFTLILLLNATGLLFGEPSATLIALEPGVLLLAAPCIAVTSLRNQSTPMQLRMSRQIVFRAGTLIVSGVGLLVLGVFGYLLQIFEGDWRIALVALASVAAAMALAIVFGSSQVRARGRRYLTEHLFPLKYDYRDEWLRITRQLTEPNPDYDLPQQVVRVLGRLALAEGGGLWVAEPNGLLVPIGQLNTVWSEPVPAVAGEALAQHFSRDERVLDLRASNERSHISDAAVDALMAFPALRFVVPLMTESRLVGIVGLTDPPIPHKLDWEDQDILSLVGREAAGIVALQASERALAEADKLHGFHQMSAFLIHDIKTIAAQLSLLLRNAERHKRNPAFIDDMLGTLQNSVQRINRLMEQLRATEAPRPEPIDLNAELSAAMEAFRHHLPRPALRLPETTIEVVADRHKLISAVSHLVQNAVDAAAANVAVAEDQRSVTVTLEQQSRWAQIRIRDSGVGMDRAFVENRLFQPFASTKGVAGLGLGAYQAKAYLRNLGGDVTVTSEPGKGSEFILRIPIGPEHD